MKINPEKNRIIAPVLILPTISNRKGLMDMTIIMVYDRETETDGDRQAERRRETGRETGRETKIKINPGKG